jgi:hypothetical protein
MLKPDSLRAAITAACPDLRRDPEKLALFVDKGRIATRHGAPLAFEYRYQLLAILTDFPADQPNALMLAVILWLRVHQPELILNHGTGNEAFTFDCVVIDDKTVDLEIRLAELSEAVKVTPRAGGGHDFEFVPEPSLDEAFPGVPEDALLQEILSGGEPLFPPSG